MLEPLVPALQNIKHLLSIIWQWDESYLLTWLLLSGQEYTHLLNSSRSKLTESWNKSLTSLCLLCWSLGRIDRITCWSKITNKSPYSNQEKAKIETWCCFILVLEHSPFAVCFSLLHPFCDKNSAIQGDLGNTPVMDSQAVEKRNQLPGKADFTYMLQAKCFKDSFATGENVFNWSCLKASHIFKLSLFYDSYKYK